MVYWDEGGGAGGSRGLFSSGVGLVSFMHPIEHAHCIRTQVVVVVLGGLSAATVVAARFDCFVGIMSHTCCRCRTDTVY